MSSASSTESSETPESGDSFVRRRYSDKHDESGCTALHNAVLQNDIQLLDDLLQHSSLDLNGLNNNGNTPLHLSIKIRCERSLIMRLLEAGCDVNIYNNLGQTALHCAVMYDKDRCLTDVMHELIKRGTDVNAQGTKYDGSHTNGYTPLHYAVETENVEALCMLLYYNAIPNKMDFKLTTPLAIGVLRGRVKTTDILFDYYDDFDTKDHHGYTILQLALISSNRLAIKMVETGADVNATSNSGPIALDYALTSGIIEIFKVVWSKIDSRFLLDRDKPFLCHKTSLSINWSAEDWLEHMNVILQSAVAFDLIQHCNEYRQDTGRKNCFWPILFNEFVKYQIKLDDRMSVLCICLTLNAAVNLHDLNSVIKLFGFNEEFEMLIYFMGSMPTLSEETSETIHPLLPFVLAMRNFTAIIALEFCEKQLKNNKSPRKLIKPDTILSVFQFFSVSNYARDRLVCYCRCLRVKNWKDISDKLDTMPSVPSLLELGRNAAHKCIRTTLKVTKPYQLHDAVKTLNLPKKIKDIICFKTPLY